MYFKKLATQLSARMSISLIIFHRNLFLKSENKEIEEKRLFTSNLFLFNI